MNTQEKKFFAPVLRHYDWDLSKKWRVEWWVPSHHGLRAKRKVSYQGINIHRSVDARHTAALYLMQSILEPDHKPIVSRPPMLERVLENARLEWRPKTYSAYKTVVVDFQKYLGRIKAEFATEKFVEDFIWNERKKGNTPGTLYRKRNALLILYNRAIKLEYCKHNPVKKTKAVKRAPISLAPFNSDQTAKLKKSLSGKPIWLGVELLYYCFIRPKEQQLLRIGHVNLELRNIYIPSTISKNKKTQPVAIPDGLLKSIERLKGFPNWYYVFSKDRDGLPGPTPVGNNWFYNQHKKAMIESGIYGNYSLYSWKHTGAVQCVKNGIHMKDLQMQLRHHSLDQVNEYLRSLGVDMSEDLKHKFPAI